MTTPPFQAPTSAPTLAQGGQLQSTEQLLTGAAGALLLLLSLGGGPVRRVVLGSLGLGLTWAALRGRNPLAAALKIEQTASGQTLVSDAVTIQASPEQLYAVWRNLETLPALMTHLQQVEVLGGNRSRWTVKAPVGTLSWDAEITADEAGKRLAWASLPGAGIANSGEVLFRPAPGGRGTEVVVRLTYQPPLGTAGAVAARIMGEEPAQQLRDDLMRFKREQELGFAPTTQGQSSGRRSGPAAPKGDRA